MNDVSISQDKMPPEKLAAQSVYMQRSEPLQFLTSLPRRRGGWFANHSLLRVPTGNG